MSPPACPRCYYAQLLARGGCCCAWTLLTLPPLSAHAPHRCLNLDSSYAPAHTHISPFTHSQPQLHGPRGGLPSGCQVAVPFHRHRRRQQALGGTDSGHSPVPHLPCQGQDARGRPGGFESLLFLLNTLLHAAAAWSGMWACRNGTLSPVSAHSHRTKRHHARAAASAWMPLRRMEPRAPTRASRRSAPRVQLYRVQLTRCCPKR